MIKDFWGRLCYTQKWHWSLTAKGAGDGLYARTDGLTSDRLMGSGGSLPALESCVTWPALADENEPSRRPQSHISAQSIHMVKRKTAQAELGGERRGGVNTNRIYAPNLP